jgi:zinc and cadmium transporter
VLAGIILFFMVEKLLIWVHCHGTEHCEVHGESKPYMLTVGDTIHNFIDGTIVAASFLVSVPLGIATSIAIFFHEIPQEMGDFGAMLHMGFSRKKTILFNLVSAAFSFLGAILTYFFAPAVQGLLGIIIMLAAGNLMYLAIADLIPELHKETGTRKALIQITVMVLGIVLMWGVMTLLE